MCIQQGMFFVDVQALVMNGKPFNPDAFLAGHKHATLKRRQHHTYSDNTSLRTTTGGGRGKVGHSDRNFILI